MQEVQVFFCGIASKQKVSHKAKFIAILTSLAVMKAIATKITTSIQVAATLSHVVLYADKSNVFKNDILRRVQ